ncbi:hypothetical protein K470DRAFT_212171 [Piedraia hortae CBS 480.64]|uniref:Leo1-domain-containing protein n=1 Tax=Piedraia hortae CBS 480.64 TaxID=1314780 RepID=A0A6A7C603_9PEZI|nr:hypothetical protein K470DRAFT_212171 [Piedraia hortae CBS 480.64]
MDLKMGRQPLPEPSDGEMYLMKVPAFMSIEPTSWDHRRFQPPVPDQSSKADSLIFSAYNTALSTIRWRRAPSNPSQLQSNARILRWSDGSLTLQLASQPTLQYEISGNALAPPLRNPAKPTPTSVSAPADKSGRAGDGTVPDEKYNESKDAFSYLIVPSEDTATLRVSHKLTAGLTVQQSGGINGVAVKKLQAQISHEAKSSRVKGGTGVGLKLIEEDPERKKQEAEKALKEKQKQERKRENAMMRDQERNSRALGRHGLSSGRGSGLNASFLEDEDGETGYTRSRKPGSARKPRQRHGSIYSDDEDFGRRNYRSREDEYDQEDDFVAPSDEEEEAPADDDDPDDGIEEPSPKRSRSTKDAEDEVEASVAPVRKRQRVIVDDDDE